MLQLQDTITQETCRYLTKTTCGDRLRGHSHTCNLVLRVLHLLTDVSVLLVCHWDIVLLQTSIHVQDRIPNNLQQASEYNAAR